jgi:dienelactone hydrolase
MSITTRLVDHTLDGEAFENLFVFDDAKQGKRPTILVFHAWEGRSADQEKFAKRLTDWGYAGFAVDVYGKGKHGKTTEECQALMMPLLQDRGLVRKRIMKALEAAQRQAEADAGQMGAIGFCFGGLCALDLARAGAKVKGVASFHGNLAPNNLPTDKPIQAKVIAFHGWDDPFGRPDQVVAFCNEMTDAGADWQFVAYGGTQHAFMNESANKPEMGLIYNAKTADRAWNSLQLFLADAFGG